ncbi:GerMN domain-containing protein [Clostridiaceae bacterium 35-E11]
MKKKMIILLCFVMVFSVFIVGCSKADKEINNDTDTVNTDVENNGQDDEKNLEEKEIDYVLYLRHKDKPFLFDEAYSIKEKDEKLQNVSMEEFIVKELIALEGYGEYVNPVPKKTKLLSVTKDNGTVIVNLSKDFVEGQKGTSNDTLLALATIVNSLTIMPDNEQVQFMIDGKIVYEVNGIDISKPMEYIQGFYPDK